MKTKITALFLCCILAGGLMMLAGKAMGYKNDEGRRFGSQAELKAFENLIINGVNADIQIIPGDSYSLDIEATKPETITWNAAGGTLNIKQDCKKSYKKECGEAEIKITIPRDFKCKNAKINLVSGDFDADNFNCDVIDINTVSGDIDLSNSSIPTIKINTVSGDAKLANVTAGSMLKMNSVSGDMSAKGNFSGAVYFKSVSGNIELFTPECADKESCYKNISTLSGRIMMNGVSLSKKYEGGAAREDKSPLDRKVTINLNNVPLSTLLNKISEQAKVNFVLDEKFGDKKITATLTDVTVREALNILLPAQGLAYQPMSKEGTYFISKRADEAP